MGTGGGLFFFVLGFFPPPPDCPVYEIVLLFFFFVKIAWLSKLSGKKQTEAFEACLPGIKHALEISKKKKAFSENGN